MMDIDVELNKLLLEGTIEKMAEDVEGLVDALLRPDCTEEDATKAIQIAADWPLLAGMTMMSLTARFRAYLYGGGDHEV